MTVFDVEQDLKADKNLKQVRKGSVRNLGKMLFDPEDFKDKSDQLTIARHRLNEERLYDYAKMASNIRKEISQKVSRLSGQDRVHIPKEAKQVMPESFSRLDYNPSHPNRKRRSLRQLDSTERLHIAKLVASKSRTCVEIAELFNVKVQVVYDLVKDSKKKQVYFIKKKKAELRKSLHQAAVIKIVSNLLSSK